MSMKRIIIPLVVLVAALSSCTTYQYSARQMDVKRHDICASNQRVAVVVDYAHQVTATSDYQSSRKDAIADAEFRCIENEKIDVVVDPIYKIECNQIKKRYRVTVIGYAGKYELLPSELEESKNYTREQIENYKLLTDPNFHLSSPPRESGDSYVINIAAPHPEKKKPLIAPRQKTKKK